MMGSSSPHYKAEYGVSYIKHDPIRDIMNIKPRALDIVWGGDSRYWKLPKDDGYAELLQVSWLEVTGQIDLNKYLKKGKAYSLKFKMELRPDNFGWGDYPVYFMVKLGQNSRVWKKDYLKSKKLGDVFVVPSDPLTFKVPETFSHDEKLMFGMYEIWKGRWKGGLVLHEVIIEPFSNN